MAVPTNQEKWSRSLRAERPWEVNPVSDELKAILHDDDLAEVIWALMREGAVKWLDTKLTLLGEGSHEIISRQMRRRLNCGPSWKRHLLGYKGSVCMESGLNSSRSAASRQCRGTMTRVRLRITNPIVV